MAKALRSEDLSSEDEGKNLYAFGSSELLVVVRHVAPEEIVVERLYGPNVLLSYRGARGKRQFNEMEYTKETPPPVTREEFDALRADVQTVANGVWAIVTDGGAQQMLGTALCDCIKHNMSLVLEEKKEN